MPVRNWVLPRTRETLTSNFRWGCLHLQSELSSSIPLRGVFIELGGAGGDSAAGSIVECALRGRQGRRCGPFVDSELGGRWALRPLWPCWPGRPGGPGRPCWPGCACSPGCACRPGRPLRPCWPREPYWPHRPCWPYRPCWPGCAGCACGPGRSLRPCWPLGPLRPCWPRRSRERDKEFHGMASFDVFLAVELKR
jgi:hypothetical protein